MYDNVISGTGFFFSPEDKSFLFPLLLFVIFLQASEEKEGKMENHKRNRIIMHNGSKIFI